MKRFDFANEVAKQLITIASAIVTVVIAFYEKFFSHHGVTFSLVFLVLMLFILSIVLGVMAVGGLVNLVERQEEADQSRTEGEQGEFVSVRQSTAQSCAQWQQVLFAAGLSLFVLVAILDRACLAKRAPALAGAAAPATAAYVENPIVWAQLRPDEGDHTGQLIARAIVGTGSECPEIAFEGQGYWNGKRGRLLERWTQAQGDFAIKICELAYPGHLAAKVAGVRLEPRPADPKTIVVLGDTGCRIKANVAQDCKNTESWPFNAIAAAARAHKPDLIVHVGDYHYREAECPDAKKCGGSPWGDNWNAWQKDFFEPAAPLLAQAPWIMVRGNHEGWTRAGNGWQLMLSPRPRDPIGSPWPDESPPYALRFRALTMAVLDAANSDDPYESQLRADGQAKRWQSFWSTLAEAPDPLWLLLHQPPWASFMCDAEKPVPCVEPNDPKQRQDPTIAAFRSWVAGKLSAPKIDLLLSGDTHMYQFFVPTKPSATPPQIVAGMSGTLLDDDSYGAVLEKTVAANLHGVEGNLWMRRHFGYVVLTKDGTEWKVALYDEKSRQVVGCDLKGIGGDICKKP